jgi:signal transduction histidine kinase
VRWERKFFILADVAWIVAALLSLAIIVAGIPVRIASLEVVPSEAARIAQQLRPWEATLFQQSSLGVHFYAVYTTTLEATSALAWLIVAAVLFWRRSASRMALFVALVLVLFSMAMNGFPDALAQENPAWSVVLRSMNALGMLFLTLFFYVFPDGRFAPRWTRWLALIAVPAYALLYLLPAPSLDPKTSWLGALVLVLLNGIGVGAQVYRYRHLSGPVERLQVKWVVAGMAALVLGLVAVILISLVAATSLRADPHIYVASYIIGYTGFSVFKLAIPLALAVAVLRYRLWNIDIIINRTLVYGALTASVIGLYVLVVGELTALLQVRGSFLISLLAAGLVAVLFQPLRERLQRGVNHLMYGERDEPYKVLSRLGQRLEATLAPDTALLTIVQTTAQALKLPYAAISVRRDGGFTTVAEHGKPAGEHIVLPLSHQGGPVGRLILAARSPGEAFSPSDRRLLEDLARQAGAAVHAAHLTADLQRSRERLVTAREEERRRLRRDLHDGLGPTLGSLPLKLDIADDLVEKDPDTAHELLRGLKAQAQSAVADIRRLVYALRPPALDDLGLVGALRETAAQYDAGGLRVAVDEPEGGSLPPLPAAVEVAAYRIAQEAMTNVVRHAGASRCAVRLELDEATGHLIVEVADDGQGLPAERGCGVGLASMRERAEELGGSCVVESLREGGTHVLASLPCGKSAGSGVQSQPKLPAEPGA